MAEGRWAQTEAEDEGVAAELGAVEAVVEERVAGLSCEL